MIYFIRDEDDGLIKIGTTVRLVERLKQLCNEVGGNLRVLAVMDGTYPEESDLHRRFAHLRVGDSVLCEWFEPGSDLVGFIVEEDREWTPEDDDDVSRKPMVVQVRGSDEWKAWVERLAAFHRGTIADVTDRALAAYARQIGFNEPPPER